MDEQKIKSNLRAKRIEKGYSQKYMADEMDIDRNTYIKLENGNTHMLSPRLYDAAYILGCPLESLLSEYGDAEGKTEGQYGGISENPEDFVLLRDKLKVAEDEIRDLNDELKKLRDENGQLKDKNSQLELMFKLQKEVADYSKEKARMLEEKAKHDD